MITLFIILSIYVIVKMYGKKIIALEKIFPRYGLIRKNNRLELIKKRYEK